MGIKFLQARHRKILILGGPLVFHKFGHRALVGVEVEALAADAISMAIR